MIVTEVVTESGTKYQFAQEVDIDNFEHHYVRRLNDDSDGDLRRDGEWLNLWVECKPVIDQDMIMYLEPLGEGNVTTRHTTRVVSIEKRWIVLD